MKIKFNKRKPPTPIGLMPVEEIIDIFRRASIPQKEVLDGWEKEFEELRPILEDYKEQLYEIGFMRYSDYVDELKELRALIPDGGDRITEKKDRRFFGERLKKWRIEILFSISTIESKLKPQKARSIIEQDRANWGEVLEKAKELLTKGVKPHKLTTELSLIFTDRKPDTLRRKLREAKLIAGRAKK